MKHATKLIAYLNKRGGRLVLTDIKAPNQQEYGMPEDAMRAALKLEKDVNQVGIKNVGVVVFRKFML